MIDKIMLNSDGTLTLIYTDRAPIKISGRNREESLQLMESVLDWGSYFKMIDDSFEITEITYKEAV